MRTLVASHAEAVAEQSYSLWRDDPEIARALNDRLLPRGD